MVPTTAALTLNDKKLISPPTIKLSFLLLLGVLIALLNVLEILMIVKIKKKKKKIYEILLLSLSLSDLMFGMSNIFVSSFYLKYGFTNQNIINATYTLYFFFIISSIFHLLFIAVNSLFMVLRPLQHKTFLTRKKVYIVIMAIWISAVLLSVLMQILNELTEVFKQKKAGNPAKNERAKFAHLDRKRNSYRPHPSPKMTAFITQNSNKYPQHLQMILSVTLVIADFIIISSYFLVIYVTTVKRKKISKTHDKISKLLIICTIIGTTFVLFTIPYAVARFILGKVPFWASFIIVLNSGMNSVIYFFRGKFSSDKHDITRSTETRKTSVSPEEVAK